MGCREYAMRAIVIALDTPIQNPIQMLHIIWKIIRRYVKGHIRERDIVTI